MSFQLPNPNPGGFNPIYFLLPSGRQAAALVFDQTTNEFRIEPATQSESEILYEANAGGFEPDPSIGTSYLGTPVFSRVVFRGGSYDELDDNGQLQTYTYPEISLDGAIVNVSQQYNVVETAVSGRRGTVKEYMSARDYAVSITAWLFNKTDIRKYPEQQIREFKRMADAPTSKRVFGKYLEAFGIQNLVVTGVNYPRGKHRNVQQVDITCVSDTPFELEPAI